MNERSSRTAAGARRRSPRLLPAVVAIVVALAIALVGCSTSPGEATPTAAAPAGSGPTPHPTAWPSSVVNAVIALGAADSQFASVGQDLTTAVDEGNLQALLSITDNVKSFLTGNQPNIPKLQGYSETKALGDGLATAYGQMIDGITKIHDSLVAGDSAGVTAGFQTFVAGNDAYSTLRADLGDKANQAIFMKKNYLL